MSWSSRVNACSGSLWLHAGRRCHGVRPRLARGPDSSTPALYLSSVVHAHIPSFHLTALGGTVRPMDPSRFESSEFGAPVFDETLGYYWFKPEPLPRELALHP